MGSGAVVREGSKTREKEKKHSEPRAPRRRRLASPTLLFPCSFALFRGAKPARFRASLSSSSNFRRVALEEPSSSRYCGAEVHRRNNSIGAQGPAFHASLVDVEEEKPNALSLLLSLFLSSLTPGLLRDVPFSRRRHQPKRGPASCLGTGKDSVENSRRKRGRGGGKISLVSVFFSSSNSHENSACFTLLAKKQQPPQPNPFGAAPRAAAAAQPPTRRRGGDPIVFGVPNPPPPQQEPQQQYFLPHQQQQQQQHFSRPPPSTPDAQRPRQLQQPATAPSEISFPAYEPLNRAVVLERARARARASHPGSAASHPGSAAAAGTEAATAATATSFAPPQQPPAPLQQQPPWQPPPVSAAAAPRYTAAAPINPFALPPQSPPEKRGGGGAAARRSLRRSRLRHRRQPPPPLPPLLRPIPLEPPPRLSGGRGDRQ